jgi:pimeloyl-ACP methyl ester carboxylesterase
VLQVARGRPHKIQAPTLILRGEFDGIASLDDLLKFYQLLPCPNKQFSIMQGISHASFQQKNYLMVYAILHGFFAMPAPSYKG